MPDPDPNPTKNDAPGAAEVNDMPEVAAGLDLPSAFVTGSEGASSASAGERDSESLPEAAGGGARERVLDTAAAPLWSPPGAETEAPWPPPGTVPDAPWPRPGMVSDAPAPPKAVEDPSVAEEKRRRRRRRFGLLIDGFAFLAIPALVVGAFAVVILAEKIEPSEDLQLLVQRVARPGTGLAIRSFLFTELERPEGPVTVKAPVRIELVNRRGGIESLTELRAGAGPNMEGVLPIPDDLSGRYKIRGTVDDPTTARPMATVQMSLRVAAGGSTPEGLLERRLSEQQTYREYGMQTMADAEVPSAIELRVVGGMCIPELPCELLLWMGLPASRVQIEPSEDVTLVDPGALPTEEISGLVPFSIVVKPTLRAIVKVKAFRAGFEVASREIQLPLGPGAVKLDVDHVIATAPVEVRLTVQGLREGTGLIVDAYRNGAWERTGSVDAAHVARGSFPLPFDPLGPGVWRIQVRTDAFGTETSAARMVLVRAAGANPPRLAEIAPLAGLRDPLGRALRTGGAQLAPEAAMRFIFAESELRVASQPASVSGQAQARAVLNQKRGNLRLGAIVAFLLGGLVLTSIVARRGLAASREANRVLAKAGVRKRARKKDNTRSALIVLGLVFLVALAFVAGAMLVAYRGALQS